MSTFEMDAVGPLVIPYSSQIALMRTQNHLCRFPTIPNNPEWQTQLTVPFGGIFEDQILSVEVAYYRRFFLVRLPIGQPLAANAFQRIVGALCILNTELRAVVVAEINLRQIAVQVLRAAMLVNASQSAFEDRKEVLKRVGMHVAARPFKFGMVNALMFRVLEFVVLRAIRQQTAVVVQHLGHQELDPRL